MIGRSRGPGPIPSLPEDKETFGFGTLASVTILTVAERFAQLEDSKYDKADLVEILDCD